MLACLQVDAGVADQLVLGDPTAPRFVYWNKKLRPTPSGEHTEPASQADSHIRKASTLGSGDGVPQHACLAAPAAVPAPA